MAKSKRNRLGTKSKKSFAKLKPVQKVMVVIALVAFAGLGVWLTFGASASSTATIVVTKNEPNCGGTVWGGSPTPVQDDVGAKGTKTVCKITPASGWYTPATDAVVKLRNAGYSTMKVCAMARSSWGGSFRFVTHRAPTADPLIYGPSLSPPFTEYSVNMCSKMKTTNSGLAIEALKGDVFVYYVSVQGI